MGLVNVVISTVGKCLDAACLLLDLNFLVVHSVVRTLLALVNFIANLPNLLLDSVLELGNFGVVCLMSTAEAASSVAHGTVSVAGSLVLALEGLLESLKMVGYLSMHVVLRGKEQLCRGVLLLVEGCSIAVSLVLYLTNTVVNFALIATQNVYLSAVSIMQMVSTPLQKVLELTLTSFTFLYSSLVGTSAFLWPPCKVVLDLLVSLVHMFLSIFILNIYGLLLTVAVTLTTTAYLNPGLTRQAAVRFCAHVNASPALRGLHRALGHLACAVQGASHFARSNIQQLQRLLYNLYLLERELWQQLSRHSSQLGLALRTNLHRDNDNRVQGDGNPGGERRDPPDGRATDGEHQELPNTGPSSSSSSSTNVALKTSSNKDGDIIILPPESLLSLLKEQEDRKKCVICQDCTKTVVLLPCRHLCLCRGCTNILLRQPIYQQNCPLCRHMILNTMDVYL